MNSYTCKGRNQTSNNRAHRTLNSSPNSPSTKAALRGPRLPTLLFLAYPSQDPQNGLPLTPQHALLPSPWSSLAHPICLDHRILHWPSATIFQSPRETLFFSVKFPLTWLGRCDFFLVWLLTEITSALFLQFVFTLTC